MVRRLDSHRDPPRSGDLGAPHAPLLPAPASPERADVLVLESTYGDRQHEDRTTRQARLKAAIDRALANGGTVILPAFSIGRTQELLYELEDLIDEAEIEAWASREGHTIRVVLTPFQIGDPSATLHLSRNT